MLSLLVVAAAGLTRANVDVGGATVSCPDRALPSALRSPPADTGSLQYACTQQSQQRMYVVVGSLMGLVLISGLLSRRQD